MRNAAVVRDDGIRGLVVADAEIGRVTVEFDDGSLIVAATEALIRQDDGTYRLSLRSGNLQNPDTTIGEVVIPVIAEELNVETHRVARARVHVTKRVEAHEEVVDAPLIREELVLERIPINTLVDGVTPTVRDEDGVLVIPLVEEVTVLEKRLLLREEVRVSRHRTETTSRQTVVLRREVVDVERDELDDVEPAEVTTERSARSAKAKKE